jgi:hypothetical protein
MKDDFDNNITIYENDEKYLAEISSLYTGHEETVKKFLQLQWEYIRNTNLSQERIFLLIMVELGLNFPSY